MSAYLPVIKIEDCDNGPHNLNKYNYDGKNSADSLGGQLFAVGAEVMLTINLWTEVGLVNSACGKVMEILKAPDGGKACILLVDFLKY